MSKTFTITDGQIRALLWDDCDDLYPKGFSCRSASEIQRKLRAWFPEAFEPEWEEVPLVKLMFWSGDRDVLAVDMSHSDMSAPFQLTRNEESKYKNDYKIENGKIWRRKA